MDAAWIDTDAAFAAVIGELAGAPRYAVDTEFHRERTYWPHLALLQVRWDGGLALVDPLAVDIAPLASVLDGPGLAIVHAADQDLEVLQLACGTIPSRMVDTQIVAGFAGFSTPSLVSLVEGLLGERLPKGDRLTDWRRRPLTPAQRSYAASDVAYLFELWERIEGELRELGRLEWALDECEAMRLRAREPQDPATAWWRIKEARQLRGRARMVAQEVAAWREREAARLDKPVRTVFPDLAVVTVANHPPATEAELKRLRGMEGRSLRPPLLEGLLDAVRRGTALDAGALRLPPVDDIDRTMRPAATLVSAWMAQLAKDLRIDSAILATRADLNLFLAGDSRSRLAHGWRAQVIGDRVQRLVRGEASLAFENGALLLEARSNQPV